VAKKPRNTRCYLCSVDRYPLKKQLADCVEYAKQNDLPVVRDHVYQPNELSSLIHNTTPFNDEVILIPRLEGLVEKKGNAPGKRFLLNVGRVCAKSLYVVDVDTGTRSSSSSAWDDLVIATYNKITRLRKPLDKEKYRAMGAIPNKEPGLVASWLAKKKAKTDDYIENAKVWGNPAIVPAENAISKFKDAELRDVHKSTIQRIFGSREACQKWLNENL